MTHFDEIFEQLKYSDKAENSLKEFNNWILGISIGIFVMLIFQIKGYDIAKNNCIKFTYVILVIVSMINTFLVGYNKYKILKRDTILEIKYGTMKKISIYSKIKYEKSNTESNPERIKEREIEIDKDKVEMSKVFSEWASEFNKIKRIGEFFNITIITTLITVVTSGIFILILILNN